MTHARINLQDVHPLKIPPRLCFIVSRSLNVLRVDKVDILLLHDPTFEELRDFLAPGGGIDALERLKREGCIDHIGLGCLEHENHSAVLEDGRFEVILTVNDCNLVRRYVLENIYPTAQSQDVGIVNAGIFYMGLLGGLRPEVSYSMGFKKDIQKPELVRLATDIYDFCEERGTSIRKAALEFSLTKFPGVSTVPVGCRTAEEVHGLVDTYEAPKLDARFWSDFDARFEERVMTFDASEHWFYSKTDSRVL